MQSVVVPPPGTGTVLEHVVPAGQDACPPNPAAQLEHDVRPSAWQQQKNRTYFAFLRHQ